MIKPERYPHYSKLEMMTAATMLHVEYMKENDKSCTWEKFVNQTQARMYNENRFDGWRRYLDLWTHYFVRDTRLHFEDCEIVLFREQDEDILMATYGRNHV